MTKYEFFDSSEDSLRRENEQEKRTLEILKNGLDANDLDPVEKSLKEMGVEVESERKKLIEFIKSAHLDDSVARNFREAGEDEIKKWTLLLLSGIQVTFNFEREERVLDLYNLGNLVNQKIFNQILSQYGAAIGFDHVMEFKQAEDLIELDTDGSEADSPRVGDEQMEADLKALKKALKNPGAGESPDFGKN